MIVRRRVERPAKPEAREETPRRWVHEPEEGPPPLPGWPQEPSTAERLAILLAAACPRWPRSRRCLVAEGQAGRLGWQVHRVPMPVWSELLELAVRGRPLPARLRRVVAPVLVPLLRATREAY